MMITNLKAKLRARGVMLFVIMLILPVLMIMTYTLLRTTNINTRITTNEYILTQAEYVGEAALRHATAVLKKNMPFVSHYNAVVPPLNEDKTSFPATTYDLTKVAPTTVNSVDDLQMISFWARFGYRIFVWSYDPTNDPTNINIRILVYYNNRLIKVYRARLGF